MPIGIIVNGICVLIGGIIGSIFSNKIPKSICDNVTLVFGVCSIGMGINSVILMENMPAVILSIIVGTIIGLAIHLSDNINKLVYNIKDFVNRKFLKSNGEKSSNENEELFLTTLVLFCVSATGIYGSIVAGISGDNSILFSKSILDLFTAIIFACTLGVSVSFICIPQVIIFLILFFCATYIDSFATTSMINDFKACGGFLLIATGLRIAKIKSFPIADMIPTFILIMPFSYLWSKFIV